LRGLSFESNPANKNNFKFLSRESQAETGLIDLINRQYDPVIGRFTSIDPVTAGQEHLSLYQYAWNNPVLRSDPNGLYPDGECCEDLPTTRSTSDATSIARGTPISLNMPRGQATPAFGLSVTVGKQIALEVGKFGVEANFGSREVVSATEMGTTSSSNTSVTTSGFSLSYGAGTMGAEKKVTTTQGEASVPTGMAGVSLKTSAKTTTEYTSNMGVGVSPVEANLEGSKTTTSYLLTNGYTTSPTTTAKGNTGTLGASAMPKKGWGTLSIGFGVKVELKMDFKQAWENIKKYGF
jgi:RHS repeat-associated protein